MCWYEVLKVESKLKVVRDSQVIEHSSIDVGYAALGLEPADPEQGAGAVELKARSRARRSARAHQAGSRG